MIESTVSMKRLTERDFQSVFSSIIQLWTEGKKNVIFIQTNVQLHFFQILGGLRRWPSSSNTVDVETLRYEWNISQNEAK